MPLNTLYLSHLIAVVITSNALLQRLSINSQSNLFVRYTVGAKRAHVCVCVPVLFGVVFVLTNICAKLYGIYVIGEPRKVF